MVNLNEQEIEFLKEELGLMEDEVRSATGQMIIKNILKKLQDNENN